MVGYLPIAKIWATWEIQVACQVLLQPHLDPGAGVVPRQVLEDAVLAEAAVQPRGDVPLGEAHRVLSLLFYHGDAAQTSAPVRLTGRRRRSFEPFKLQDLIHCRKTPNFGRSRPCVFMSDDVGGRNVPYDQPASPVVHCESDLSQD